MLAKGVVCAGGSDSPVEPLSPLLGMHDAIFRSNRRRLQAAAAADAISAPTSAGKGDEKVEEEEREAEEKGD